MFERFKQHLRALHEVDALSQRDLDEIGMSKGDLRAVLTTGPEVLARMEKMAALHGLSHRALTENRSDYVGFVAECRHCGAVRTCEKALANASVTAAETAFCPNAAAYDAMAAGQTA
ncbi:DUF6455 family protein [Ostreiculturibacter nitratireducens]|uniref:DUF6455 family protein n=1 Tax=Ostreiculturibacter nitratireducens TaxID=3075226 RepID=UPI0031B5A500